MIVNLQIMEIQYFKRKMNKKEYQELWFFVNEEMNKLSEKRGLQDVETTKIILLKKITKIYFMKKGGTKK